MAASQISLSYCPSCRREFQGERATCPADGARLRAVPRHAPEPGCVLDDRLLVRDKLGGGGMGTIYRAKDLDDGQDLALKVLKPQLGRDRAAVAQFYHEARAAGRLSHPNVVHIHSFGRSSDGFLYIAMELLEGSPLAAFLSRREPLAPALALEVGRQVCQALGAAHDKGTVHRDLKPENVFLVPDDPRGLQVKVLDFGIASVLAYDAERLGPQDERVSGTPAYMSPEQVMGRPVDARSDLYSLGILLFEMLTGHTPFDAADPVDLCRQHLQATPPDLDIVLPPAALPPDLVQLVRQLLLKQPSRRPRNASLVGARLEAILAELGPLPPVPWAVDEREDHEPLRDPREALRIPDVIRTPRPPLVRAPEGGLRVMPYKGGALPSLDRPPLLPRVEDPTLVSAFAPLAPIAEAMTLRSALWICPACARLNARADGPCENCGVEMEGPRSGVPAAPEGLAEACAPRPWAALAEPEVRDLAARPREDTEPGLDRVAAPLASSSGPAGAEDATRVELALLHVLLSGDGPGGEALPTEEIRERIEGPLAEWTRRLRAQGGFVCQDAGHVLRVLFGALSGPRHHRWLEQAADAALSLRESLAPARSDPRGTVYLRAALTVGVVFLDAEQLASPDMAIEGSPLDLATRLARTAPAGEVVLNGACWRRVASAFSGRPCNTFRARGATHPELIYRLDARRRRRITHRRLPIPAPTP